MMVRGLHFSSILGSTYGPTKIAKPAVFQAVLRGIGKSFQSAITAPRMNLTGYGNATAQSCHPKVIVNNLTQPIIASIWYRITSVNCHYFRDFLFETCSSCYSLLQRK